MKGKRSHFVGEINFIVTKQAKLTKFTSRENNLLKSIAQLHLFCFNLDSQSKRWLQIFKTVCAKVYDFIFSLIGVKDTLAALL